MNTLVLHPMQYAQQQKQWDRFAADHAVTLVQTGNPPRTITLRNGWTVTLVAPQGIEP